MSYLIIFLAFSFLGWIIDSFYSSFKLGKPVLAGYFRGVPICPIYGFGGILLVNTFAFFNNLPFWIVIPVATLLVVLVEYIGGKLSEHFLEERLWDYSKERFNIDGYISAWHSFLWLAGVSLLYFSFGEKIHIYISWLDSRINMDQNLETILIFAVVSIAFWVTIKNKKLRLSKLVSGRKQKPRLA